MARTDPKAKWLYQGWAIRGWDDAAGASRLRALYDAVPHGQQGAENKTTVGKLLDSVSPLT